MSIYLDTSVIVPLFARDALTRRAFHVLRTTSALLSTSDLAAAEFASTIGVKLRRGDLLRGEAERAFGSFDEWLADRGGPIGVTTADVALAAAWLRRLTLTLRAPDALHLAIAARLGLAVLTFDSGMATAATALRLPLAVA